MSQRGVTGLRGASAPTVAKSWERQGWPLRILRAFLGVTFLYAGIQKLADANFLHSGTPDFIGNQLNAFGQGSPIASLLRLAGHAPLLTGLAVALVEIAVGLGTLLGIAPVAEASMGLAVNMVLLLSATWHVHPYFLGSDSIYAVAWAAYLVGEVGIERKAARAARAAAAHGSRRARQHAGEGMGRREFLRGGLLAGGTVVLGMIASGFRGRPASAAGAITTPPRTTPSPSAGQTPTPAASGNTIAILDQVPIGGAMNFNDPSQGPAVLVRLAQDKVAAYSRVCTHAGCLVEYDQRAKLLFCPCHGAEFDPSQHPQPIAGPAPTPLPAIPVTVDASTGQVVATA